MATVAAKRMTVEEFYQWAELPENRGKRLELDEGEAVEMPPPGELHGAVCFLVGYLLGKYLFQRGKGYICTNDTGLLLKRKPGIVRGPDIMLFIESRPLRKLSRKHAVHLPRLVVEVLSPNDQMAKVNRRISQYLKRGVPLVWLVDPEARAVTVYRSNRNHFVLAEADEITGEDILPGLRYQVAEFFALPGEAT